MTRAEGLFPKKTDSLPSVFAFLSEAAGPMELPDDFVPMLHLVVEEVFVNLVRYNTETRNDIQLTMSRDRGELRIQIIDHDVDGYDLTKHAEVDTGRPAHERRPGGLGIHFVRQIMDDVAYTYDNRTSTITLVKRLGDADAKG